MLSLLLAVSLSTSPYGVNGHLPGDADLASAQDVGFGWVRFDFNWFQIEPQAGQYDWTATDAAVDSAVAHGLSIYPTLAYTPAWAGPNPSCTYDDPNDATRCQTQPFANVQDWKDFVTAVVNRYKDRIGIYGMWNEPNLGGFWQGTQMQYEQDVLVPGSAAVHAACATCLVGGPETSGLTASSTWNGANGVCAFGGCIRNGWELDLGGVLDAAGSSIDVVTQHFYNSDVQGEVVGQLADGTFFGTLMTHDSLRDVLASHGAATKPIWLTETGYESSASTEQTQSDFLSGLLAARGQLAAGDYTAAQHQPFVVENLFLYDLRDGGSDGWGLIRADGSHKPSYDAVKSWIAGHPSLTTSTPTPTPSATPTDTITPAPSDTPTPGTTPGGNGASGGGGCDVAGDAGALSPIALVALLALTSAARRRRAR